MKMVKYLYIRRKELLQRCVSSNAFSYSYMRRHTGNNETKNVNYAADFKA